MTPSQIAHKLQEKFAHAITAALPEDKHPRVHIDGKDWRALAEHLRRDPELDFDWLGCLTAIDYVADNKLCCAYDLRSSTHGHWFCVKVYINRDDAKLPTVSDLWPAADWHEREAYDMMGIVFENHPDPRRILLPEDWVGFPLRKDYVFPREYHGIPGTYEMDWQQKPDYPT
jgi:NADH-quinone oxidoreductase subunit C